MNPYLAMAGQLAAGIKGIEEKLKLAKPEQGDAYEGTSGFVPRNLRDAMGDDVVQHYVRAASWELEEFDKVVTDYEIARGFERV